MNPKTLSAACLLALLLAGVCAAGEPEASCAQAAVDSRIELLGVLKTLVEAEVGADDSAYRKTILSHFDRHKDHPVLRDVRQITRTKQDPWRSLARLMLNLSPPPELQVVGSEFNPLDPDQDRLRRGLSDFVSRSGFLGFFKASEGLYSKLKDPLAGQLAENCLDPVKEYLGMNLKARYHVILSPIGDMPRLHAIIPRIGEAAYDIYAVLPPADLDPEKNGVPLPLNDYLRVTAWHEFSHAVLDPMAEKAPLFERSLSLYTPIRGLARRTDWKNCVGEHLVRAVTHRLIALRLGPEAAKRSLEKDLWEGYAYMPAAVEPLKAYEQGRPRFPTIGDFYLDWLQAFLDGAGRTKVTEGGTQWP